MEKRLPLFMLLSVAVLLGYPLLMARLFPQPAAPPVAKLPPVKGPNAAAHPPAGGAPAGNGEKPAVKPTEEKPGANGSEDGSKKNLPTKEGEPEPVPKVPLQYVALGSLDPTGQWRMLVTITNRGGAVARIELNRPRYRDQEDPTGYLGHLMPIDAPGGARVQVVGPGTPAAAAGLRVGDVITGVAAQKILHTGDLISVLDQYVPGDKVDLAVMRDGKPRTLHATLTRRPLELIRPEWETKPVESPDSSKHDPLSLLMTLSTLGDKSVLADEDELPGVTLEDVNWEVTQSSADHVELVRRLPHHQLTIFKRYALAQVKPEEVNNDTAGAYHLTLEVEIRRDAAEPLDIAYRLDGPNGLPTEGWWYLRKISRTWGTAGMRDVAAHFDGGPPVLINCSTIAKSKGEPWQPAPLGYVGVDTQYFSTILIPQKPLNESWHSRVETRLVGAVPDDKSKIVLTNVSCRLTSATVSVSRDQPLKHSYLLFAGPKEPDLLEKYGPPKMEDDLNLSELIYYGWAIWGWSARPLSHILHLFAMLGNYGLAIILLTIVVRMCMFPMSRKQALGAQKMQEIQPEMKRISERYKKDLEKRQKALQELYKKHNYSPLSGCLPMFIQLPIFYGLYRCLSIDIELRQTPLITESLGWCTNLAAPDMLLRWDGFKFMPAFLLNFLGPYLNVLPLLTVVLFLFQQKMFMPPPADENAAMQQKIMQYMMIFMAFMFFRVPSGLCLYFIASSLWGIGERKLLPKPPPRAASTAVVSKA